MSMFNDIAYRKPGNEQKCFENATEVTEYAKQFQLGHWCFCGFGRDSGTVRARTHQAGEWDRISWKMKFEGTSHPTSYFDESNLKGDLKSQTGKETIHVQSTTDTKAIVIRTFCACNPLCLCVRTHQNKEARHRDVPELSEADLMNLTHRKDLTASGDRMRDSKRSNATTAQVSQVAGFSAEVGKGQYFVT